MRQVFPASMKRLKQARAHVFSRPVTAYLTKARFLSDICIGVTHMHRRANPITGHFTDGRFIHTSRLLRIEHEAGFWILYTLSGSFYVIVSLCPYGGAESLHDALELLTEGISNQTYGMQ